MCELLRLEIYIHPAYKINYLAIKTYLIVAMLKCRVVCFHRLFPVWRVVNGCGSKYLSLKTTNYFQHLTLSLRLRQKSNNSGKINWTKNTICRRDGALGGYHIFMMVFSALLRNCRIVKIFTEVWTNDSFNASEPLVGKLVAVEPLVFLACVSTQ